MSEAHAARDHALLAPSAAHRWLACPGSVALEDRFPRSSSAAANEGTAAHELGAWALLMAREPSDMLGRVIDINGENHHLKFLVAGSPIVDNTRWPVTAEMVEAVDTYVSHVRSLGGARSIEQKLHMSEIHAELWGTGDALVYIAETKTLHVCDFKYGRGVEVEAEGNPQLLAYASGAITRLSNVGPVETVVMTIVQPRIGPPIKTWTLPKADLDLAEAELARGADRAMEAFEKYVPDARTPAMQSAMGGWAKAYLAAGEHCRFCKAGATCSMRAEKALLDAQAEFAADGAMTLPGPADMTPERLADLLGKARQIQHWVNAVEEHAHAEATAGRVPPGFKLVAKRATRNWTDEASFIAAAPVMLTIAPAEMYADPKLLSPAQLEKKLPKDERDMLSAFVTSASSGTNLVPVDDKRPPSRPSAADEFTPVTQD